MERGRARLERGQPPLTVRTWASTFASLPCACDKCVVYVPGPLRDLGDTMLNKTGIVLALSGERDDQQENKTINRNAGEEAEEGDRDKAMGKELGGNLLVKALRKAINDRWLFKSKPEDRGAPIT